VKKARFQEWRFALPTKTEQEAIVAKLNEVCGSSIRLKLYFKFLFPKKKNLFVRRENRGV
jgi:hypothetical protein